jgi:O-antigen ligase
LAIAAGEKGYLRILAVVSCCAQCMALALTYSRGAWLGGGAAMVFLAATMNRRREVAAIIILTGLTATFVTPLQTRFSTLLDPQSDFAITDRLQVIHAALTLAVANPVLGVGYGRDRLREGLIESQLEMRRIAHTHNVYVELLATTGLLGLGAFLWLICGAFYQALSHSMNREAPNRPAQLGIAAAWIAFAVTGLGDVPFYHHETRIFFFSLVALTYLYTREVNPGVSTLRRS